MQNAPRIYFTVTNDLSFDQRMHRICGSLAAAGYDITLVGRTMPNSPPLAQQPYKQIRLTCKYHKGKRFYAQYNLLLYRYLLLQKMDAICAIDLDTILPVLLVSKKKNIVRLYDAHEYFTELTEVKRRKLVHTIWIAIEKYCVPKFITGYTVCQSIATLLSKKYGVNYGVIRNLPLYNSNVKTGISTENSDELAKMLARIYKEQNTNTPSSSFILYQGAINEGRGLLQLINAMPLVNAKLVLAGTGNLMEEVSAYIAEKQLQHKVIMLGNLSPNLLKQLTPLARIGINLVENTGLSQYYSLANKYFDYIMAEKPQVSMNFPEYKAINDKYVIALLINTLSDVEIADAINQLLQNETLYNQLQQNCAKAAKYLCWEKEEPALLTIWQKILPIAAT